MLHALKANNPNLSLLLAVGVVLVCPARRRED